MNILVLPPSGGSLNSLRPEFEIYRSLADAGFKISIILSTNCPYIPFLNHPNFNIIYFDIKHKISVSFIKLIRQTIKLQNIQLVYATQSRRISNAVLACIGLNVKLVIYRGTTGGLYRLDPSSYLNGLNPRVDAIICVSKTVETSVKQKISNTLKPVITTIYKGHDLSWYQNKPADLSQFNVSKSDFSVACILNARPHKGLIYLLEAASELSDLQNLHIILVGSDTDKKHYVDLIEKSGMQKRIHITGYRQDAPEIIAACKVLVFPSYRKEGLPRVLLESLSYKTPIISARNDCAKEVIEDGINGFLVPIKDSHAIAEKVRYLYKNPTILKSVSENTQQTIQNKLSHNRTVGKYIKFFKRL